jgi:hypothetical protein
MSVAALFAVTKSWSQPRCPSTDEWKIWCIYILEYLSALKKNEVMAFAGGWAFGR